MQSSKRAITVFNYSHGAAMAVENETSLRQKIANSISSTWLALATLKSRIIYTAGNGNKASGIPGFYTSFDPMQSAEYGGKFSDWLLLEIRLQTSFRYLELGVSQNKDALGLEAQLSNSTIKALKAAGCDEKSSALLFISPKNAACAKIVAMTLKTLSVQGLLYPFGSSFTSVCPEQAFAALIIIDSAAIGTAQITAVTSAILQNTPNSNDSRLFAALMELGDKNSPNYQIGIQRKSGVNPLPLDAAKSWVESNLFGCGVNTEYVDLKRIILIVIN